MALADESGRLRPVTVLFADISGSTRLYAERGDRVGFELTTKCLDLMTEAAVISSGRLLKRLGDGLLVVFERGENAVQAAVAMLRRLDEPGCTLKADGVRIRVGLSYGPAVVSEADVHGDVVNVAAGLVSLASADEILLSGELLKELPEAMRESSRPIDRLSVRNRPEAVAVYQYLCEREDATIQLGAPLRELLFKLEIECGDQAFQLGVDRPRLKCGRSAENDVTIDKPVVSRRHAEIAFRGDRFVLTDFSTNGTYVHPTDGSLLRVVRGERTLTGSGRITLGASDTEPALQYRLSAGT